MGGVLRRLSQLQPQTALSTTEAEAIAMSMTLCNVIPIMDLIQEMKDRHIPVICSKPYVYCNVFEDNAGAMELARLPKLHPHTKHINVCYHHFREHVPLKTKYKYCQNKLFIQIHYFVLNKHLLVQYGKCLCT